jgi:hypothetical protein
VKIFLLSIFFVILYVVFASVIFLTFKRHQQFRPKTTKGASRLCILFGDWRLTRAGEENGTPQLNHGEAILRQQGDLLRE